MILLVRAENRGLITQMKWINLLKDTVYQNSLKEETDEMNRPVFAKEIKSIINNFLNQESTMGLLVNLPIKEEDSPGFKTLKPGKIS